MILSNMPIIKRPKTIGSENAKTDLIFGTNTETKKPNDKKNSCINNIVRHVSANTWVSKFFVLKTSAEIYDEMTNMMFVAIIMTSAAASLEVKTLNLEIGFDNKKSAVLPAISLERIPVPKFIAWILPTSHKYVSIYPKNPRTVKNDSIRIPKAALIAGGNPCKSFIDCETSCENAVYMDI